MGSSLPNHDAKVGKDRQKRDQRKKKQRKPKGKLHQTRLERKTTIENITLYDAWIEWKNDACSNALRTVQLYFQNKEWTWT